MASEEAFSIALCACVIEKTRKLKVVIRGHFIFCSLVIIYYFYGAVVSSDEVVAGSCVSIVVFSVSNTNVVIT